MSELLEVKKGLLSLLCSVFTFFPSHLLLSPLFFLPQATTFYELVEQEVSVHLLMDLCHIVIDYLGKSFSVLKISLFFILSSSFFSFQTNFLLLMIRILIPCLQRFGQQALSISSQPQSDCMTHLLPPSVPKSNSTS
jgi:hypothetical protein